MKNIPKKTKHEYGFIVVMKRKTPNKEVHKLMTKILKKNYVKYIRAKMIMTLNDMRDVKVS